MELGLQANRDPPGGRGVGGVSALRAGCAEAPRHWDGPGVRHGARGSSSLRRLGRAGRGGEPLCRFQVCASVHRGAAGLLRPRPGPSPPACRVAPRRPAPGAGGSVHARARARGLGLLLGVRVEGAAQSWGAWAPGDGARGQPAVTGGRGGGTEPSLPVTCSAARPSSAGGGPRAALAQVPALPPGPTQAAATALQGPGVVSAQLAAWGPGRASGSLLRESA